MASKGQECAGAHEVHRNLKEDVPTCNSSSAAISCGRWLSPSVVMSNNATIFGDMSWPLVWQPYDCQLRWMDSTDLLSCFAQTDIIIVGMSRERTTFFDLFEFQNRSIHYEKVQFFALALLSSIITNKYLFLHFWSRLSIEAHDIYFDQ